MNFIDEIIQRIATSTHLDEDFSFQLSKKCSALLNSSDSEQNVGGRRVLIYILSGWDKLPQQHHAMWVDLLEAAGFYPYIARDLDKSRLLTSTSQIIRTEFHSSKGFADKYFHEEQKAAARLLERGDNLIVSAPTSFGKSLLIHEMIASKKFTNIVIIQPTLALIDETRKKILSYADGYKIISRTTQSRSEDKNIFIFTAERVMEYQNFPEQIDFFVVDEFYKLSHSRQDERVDALNNATYKLLGLGSPQFYMLGPNIDSVSPGFLERYNATFIKTNYSLVDSASVNCFKDIPLSEDEQEWALFDLLESKSDEQTIIFCSSPSKARSLATKYLEYVQVSQKIIQVSDLPVCKWIRTYIHPSWSLIDCLNHGIGVHDAALPRHVSATVIDLFNAGKIKWLFCTSTIIEGVNTTAKNVVYFHNKRGENNVDYFDYSNIRGRAGRLMVHYVGSIFNFHKPPEPAKINIDIPFVDQEGVSDEILINLDKKDVKEPNTEQYQRLERIPLALRKSIAKNGLSVEGQLTILNSLYKGLRNSQKRQLIIWHGIRPSYEQLGYIFELCWPQFHKKRDGFILSHKQLTFFLNKYSQGGIHGTITTLIEKGDSVDAAVRKALGFQRYWIEYTIPKWISVINELQRLASTEQGLAPGNYGVYIKRIENDFVPENIAHLLELGVPRSALEKLQRSLSNVQEEDISDYVMAHPYLLEGNGLLEYEQLRLKEALGMNVPEE